MNITDTIITPNPVYTGSSIYISVAISDPETWLLDNQENFLVDTSGAYILTTE